MAGPAPRDCESATGRRGRRPCPGRCPGLGPGPVGGGRRAGSANSTSQLGGNIGVLTDPRQTACCSTARLSDRPAARPPRDRPTTPQPDPTGGWTDRTSDHLGPSSHPDAKTQPGQRHVDDWATESTPPGVIVEELVEAPGRETGTRTPDEFKCYTFFGAPCEGGNEKRSGRARGGPSGERRTSSVSRDLREISKFYNILMFVAWEAQDCHSESRPAHLMPVGLLSSKSELGGPTSQGRRP